MRLFRKKPADIPRRRLSDDIQTSAASFSRNRTISTSISNKVKGVNIVKSGIDSPRSHVHHLSIRRQKVTGALLLILLIIIVLWILISNFTANASVSAVGVSLKKSEADKYSKIIQDYMGQNPLARLSFLNNKKTFNAYVQSRASEVQSLSYDGMRQIGKTGFLIVFRKPIVGWVINNKQYYVDSTGVSFEANYFDNPSVQVVDNTGVPIQAGSASVSRRLLGFIGRVVAKSNQAGYAVTKAILPANTMRELDLTINNGSTFVKFSIDRKIGEQVEDMSRAMLYFKANGITPSYIDVRVSGKAAYK